MNQVWIFNKKLGLKSWIALCWQIWRGRYDEIYDLHRSLRTLILRFLFLIWSLRERTNSPEMEISFETKNTTSMAILFSRSYGQDSFILHPWFEKYSHAFRNTE